MRSIRFEIDPLEIQQVSDLLEGRSSPIIINKGKTYFFLSRAETHK